MTRLKVQKIGNSLGVILPKKVLIELGVGEGDELFLTKTPDGFKISNPDEKFKKTMEIAEKVMDEYSETLKVLAK